MKSVNAKICALITVFGAVMSFQSCNKTKDPGPGIISFSTATATYGEDQGAINVEIKLSAKQGADVTVNYTFNGTADTYLNGDYSLVTAGPIVIAAGQTTAQIQLKAIDDTQIDADDVLTLKLTSVTGHAQLSTTVTDLSFVLTISNNDNTPANGLQMDLTWDQGLNSNIDAVNLDLFLLDNVDISNNSITSASIYTSSESKNGFETTLLNLTDTDQDYYIAIQYTTGAGLVNYVLNLNGFGYDNESDAQPFPASSAPSGTNVNSVVYGPFTKSTDTFTFSGRAGSFAPKGKILMYKATNLIKR